MRVRPQSSDTSAEADRFLIERYRAMTPAQKLEQFQALCRASHELAAAGIRHRHPDASHEEIAERLAAMRLPESAMQWLRGRRSP